MMIQHEQKEMVSLLPGGPGTSCSSEQASYSRPRMMNMPSETLHLTLRCFSVYKQDDWSSAIWLQVAEAGLELNLTFHLN